jgi:hypothetical protein
LQQPANFQSDHAYSASQLRKQSVHMADPTPFFAAAATKSAKFYMHRTNLYMRSIFSA